MSFIHRCRPVVHAVPLTEMLVAAFHSDLLELLSVEDMVFILLLLRCCKMEATQRGLLSFLVMF